MADHTAAHLNSLPQDSAMQTTFSRPSRRLSRGASSQNGSQQRRSVRVEKPRSNHNSPRAGDRRRMTPSSKRYTTLDDHFNMMFGYTEDNTFESLQERPHARPISWHPGSSRSLQEYPPVTSGQTASLRPREDSGDSSTCSIYASGLPFHNNYSTSGVHTAIESYANSPSGNDFSYEHPVTHRLSSHSAFEKQPTPWSVPDWVQMTQSRSRAHSSPTSPELLPIQTPLDPEEMDEGEFEEGGKALVGMGLYDPPEGYNSWFASGPEQSNGKGLKLEETFEPPEENEDDSESEAEDEEDEQMDEGRDSASSDEVSVEEPLPPPPAPVEATTLPIKYGSKYPEDQSLPVDMSGQTFFLEDDESLQKEWWYQRLRSGAQPAAHGMGYGWI